MGATPPKKFIPFIIAMYHVLNTADLDLLEKRKLLLLNIQSVHF